MTPLAIFGISNDGLNLAVKLVVLFLVGGGAYLASREYFFVGTNSQGILTIYRGFPYDLPLGIHMYEQWYVSGVPVSAIPADRRSHGSNHRQHLARPIGLNIISGWQRHEYTDGHVARFRTL